MDERDIQAYLEHHGVKGMRWGVHRSHPSESSSGPRRAAKPTKEQIGAARARQEIRRKDYKTAKKTKNPEKIQKAIDAFNNNPDRAVGAYMTRGEKVVTALWGGAYGGAAANRASNLTFGKQYAQGLVNSQIGVLTIPVQTHRARQLGNVQISA